jgi:hypothetical protein
MQRLSMNMLAVFLVLAISGAGFAKKPAPAQGPASAQTPAPASPAKKAFINYYYWYSEILGEWNDYETTPWEIWEMEIYFDCTVNTDQVGGMLIEEGYPDPNFSYPAMVFLYAHF